MRPPRSESGSENDESKPEPNDEDDDRLEQQLEELLEEVADFADTGFAPNGAQDAPATQASDPEVSKGGPAEVRR